MVEATLSFDEELYINIPVRELSQVGWDHDALAEYLFFEGYYDENTYSKPEEHDA